jgi:SLOG cluster4 family
MAEEIRGETLNDEDILNVGVIGFYIQKFDESEARDALENILDDLEEEYILSNEFKDIIIVSGLTNMGIPKVAYDLADERSYETIGIAPEEARGMKHAEVDQIIFVGEKFGDESETFIDAIDVLIKLGGGKQSEKEATMADEEDIPVIEYDFE